MLIWTILSFGCLIRTSKLVLWHLVARFSRHRFLGNDSRFAHRQTGTGEDWAFVGVSSRAMSRETPLDQHAVVLIYALLYG